MAAAIVAACHGRGNRAQCPVCAEQGRDTGRNHLSVAERGGKVLVKCFAGCEQGDLIEALRRLGIWPERERPLWTPDEKRTWVKRRAEAETLTDRILWWHRGLVLTLEAEAADAGALDDWDRLEPAARRLHLLHAASPDELLVWHGQDANARKFEQIGRADFEHADRVAREAVEIIAAAATAKVAA